MLYNPTEMESYAAGPQTPLIEKTIPQVFAETVERFGTREAIISRHQNLRLTYNQLHQKVEQTAAGLYRLGIRPGDRVGMWASSCAEWIYLQVATGRVGAVLVNVNPAYRAHDLAYILERSGMKAIFLYEKDNRANYLEILREASDGRQTALEHSIVLERPGETLVDAKAPAGATNGIMSWSAMLALTGGLEGSDTTGGLDSPAAPPYQGSPDDVVNIQYTSGTTGKPKGVLLTHKNIINNARLIGQTLQWTEQDRLCMPVPLYHCFGCVAGSLQCLVFGASLVIPSAQFDPLAGLQAIEQERCTTIYGVPTMFISELDHPDFAHYDMSSLRTGIMAGAPCPIELMKRVVSEMHCSEMTIVYGQTEASPAVTQTSTGDPLEIRVSTVGRVLPCTEVKIIQPESGQTVPAGEQGELCTRGYLVMKGYDDDPDATARAVDSDGWLHSGDLATMSEDGNIRITGRAKEMIIRGGENIYPREIEEFLHAHPKIADVYVVGLPDERLGERVLAWVQLKAGESASEADIKDFCKEKIAHFKIPEFIRFVDGFPMTVTGKVQKFVIRQQEIELRGFEPLSRDREGAVTASERSAAPGPKVVTERAREPRP